MEKEHLEEQQGNNTAEENLTDKDGQTDNVAEDTADNDQITDEGTDEISEEISELDQLKSELAEAKDKYLRLYSEFENFRRRTAKEKLSLIGTANEDIISALLPVLDDFERAEESNKNVDMDSIQEGFALIHNKLKKILEQKGLKVMESDAGMDFDPELHEAITQTPAPKKKFVGKVVDVIEKGYNLGDKVIRFAKVVIGT